MQAAGRTLSGERGVHDVSIHTDVCRGRSVTDMPGVLGPEHLGATRRARFRSKERVLDHGYRLPKLHEREQRVCRREAFLYCRCIFRLLCRLDISVGGPAGAVARHRAVGTGPELSFAGFRTSERSTGAGALQSVGFS